LVSLFSAWLFEMRMLWNAARPRHLPACLGNFRAQKILKRRAGHEVLRRPMLVVLGVHALGGQVIFGQPRA
jgi:hypothetical protein